MLRPTSGNCEVLGHSVLRDAAAARRSLGICPQQNVLFGSLSVMEHLLLYASIKGVAGAEASVELRLGYGLVSGVCKTADIFSLGGHRAPGESIQGPGVPRKPQKAAARTAQT